MRILLCNKFYYPRGGDCTCLLNLEQLLKSHGHEVAVFSMQYSKNLPNPWSKFWPQAMKIQHVISRPFGSHEVIIKFTAMLEAFQPEVVHLHNIHTQLSPIIAKIAHEKGIRVVWTLHDSKLVCPCYTCMRNGKWCIECFTDKKAVIKHRCMPGGLLGSFIGYLEMRKWNPLKLQKYTDLFLPPSVFMANTCIAGGYSKEKFQVLYNFINEEKFKNSCFDKENYYVFLGRLTQVKGIKTLCKAAKELPYRLIVIGGGELEYELKVQYAQYTHIQFIGQKDWDEFKFILQKARFLVIPSEWSENNPLSVIEALSLGTPVLGAKIGGIPEMIQEGINGLTFESSNAEELKNKIHQMFHIKFNYSNIADQAIKKYASNIYYQEIIKHYKNIK